ncbi:deoxyribodipyrimidine photo-lyase [Flavobacterium sp. YO64]|uniref:deoxyribodipyrimidine photo-lyase n=1 Tax=Flavobacterium sp. YO64 TaxID=394559 RepID=UPI001F50CC61|nr:deoxyribodipyrimidine photo-lyase [Flavobacterium sp. YO64]
MWFKRDLRFTDHEPLFMAQQENIPLLLVYFFEPSIMTCDDADVRHWRFVYESLKEMQSKLKSFAAQIYYFHNQVQTVFEHLCSLYEVQTVFSHQEIGNKVTFDRDIAMQFFLMIIKFFGNNLSSMVLSESCDQNKIGISAGKKQCAQFLK